eukprot:gene17775-biopygen5123
MDTVMVESLNVRTLTAAFHCRMESVPIQVNFAGPLSCPEVSQKETGMLWKLPVSAVIDRTWTGAGNGSELETNTRNRIKRERCNPVGIE